jgi:hypothetical protein
MKVAKPVTSYYSSPYWTTWNLKELKRITKDIVESIDRMENAESSCTCDKPDAFSYIAYGDYKEIITRCTNCGGAIDDE